MIDGEEYVVYARKGMFIGKKAKLAVYKSRVWVTLLYGRKSGTCQQNLKAIWTAVEMGVLRTVRAPMRRVENECGLHTKMNNTKEKESYNWSCTSIWRKSEWAVRKRKTEKAGVSQKRNLKNKSQHRKLCLDVTETRMVCREGNLKRGTIHGTVLI